MILAVTKISHSSIELTDGWYKARAYVDPSLQRSITGHKIQVGTKLEICGAKVYYEDGDGEEKRN